MKRDCSEEFFMKNQCSVPAWELVNDPDISKPIMVEVSENVTVVSAVEDGDIM